MSWLTNLGALASLIIEILKLIKKEEAKSLVTELKNAETSDEKRAVAQRLSAHLY